MRPNHVRSACGLLAVLSCRDGVGSWLHVPKKCCLLYLPCMPRVTCQTLAQPVLPCPPQSKIDNWQACRHSSLSVSRSMLS